MSRPRPTLCLLVFLLATACKDKPDPRFAVQGEEVSDSTSGLTWKREPSPSAMPLADAKAWCEASGHRLPSLDELMGITRRVRVYESLRGWPAIDRNSFPGTPRSEFWALADASQMPSGPKDTVFVVDFSDGTHHSLIRPNEAARVRCVR